MLCLYLSMNLINIATACARVAAFSGGDEGVLIALDYPLSCRPLLRQLIPARAAFDLGPVQPRKHRPEHRTVERRARREFARARAFYYAVLIDVLHRVVVPVALSAQSMQIGIFAQF